MSLLKEGDGVNFQKASCTLDGCVKIYTSRVDSVANETGKLLSGLAESRSDKRQGDVNKDVDDDEASPGDDEEGAAPKKARKRVWTYKLTTIDQVLTASRRNDPPKLPLYHHLLKSK